MDLGQRRTTLQHQNWCPGEPNNAGGQRGLRPALLIGAGSWCWNDTHSPYTGPNVPPTRAIIEISDGDRVNFDYNYPSNCTFVPSPLRRRGQPGRHLLERRGNTAQHKAYISQDPITPSWPVNGSGVPARGSQRPRPDSSRRSLSEARTAGRERGPHPDSRRDQGRLVRLGSFTPEAPDRLWNDGMSIAVVDANGHLIANLDYADTVEPQTTARPSTSSARAPLSFVPPLTTSGRRGCSRRFRIRRT